MFVEMNRAYIFVIITALLFGSMEVACKIGGNDLDPFQLTFLRFVIGALVLLPFAVSELKKRHMAHIEQKYEQLSIFGKDKRKDAETRHIEAIFKEFEDWVRDGVEIENVPYIRIIAAFTGANV